ncbi:MAG: PQQ-dependent sugar dehydrogenase [Bacteroidales bacterium]
MALILVSLKPLWAQPQIELQPFASGLDNPVGLTHAGDERLFVIQQRGLIRILDQQGNVMETPFLDLSTMVSQEGNETGLLGLAFHPDYEQNGYFFVNYTRQEDGTTVVSRFTADAENPDVADPESEKQLLTIQQPFSNHNAGNLLFGPDGYLYIAVGDGGSAGDPEDNGQNPDTLLGKMLRIDVDVEDDQVPYAIPAGNPFVDDDNVRDEIWAWGLRNPWRNSFDRHTGDLWIADVGQNQREEVNFQPADSQGGENYGWNCYEGNVTYDTIGCQEESQYVFPVYDYQHQGSQCTGAVTGGYVYRGSIYSGLFGQYIFADFCTGTFYRIDHADGGFEGSALETFSPFEYTSFGEDQYGELYVVLRGAGEIQLVADTSQCEPVAMIMTQGPITLEPGETEPLEAVFNPALNYQWYLDGEPLDAEINSRLVVDAGGEYTLEAVNPANECSAMSDPVMVTVGATSIDLQVLNGIDVYPNPATDHLRIEGLPVHGMASIRLMDITGRTVISTTSWNEPAFVLKTTGLRAGLYLLKINYEKEVLLRKVVIRSD